MREFLDQWEKPRFAGWKKEWARHAAEKTAWKTNRVTERDGNRLMERDGDQGHGEGLQSASAEGRWLDGSPLPCRRRPGGFARPACVALRPYSRAEARYLVQVAWGAV